MEKIVRARLLQVSKACTQKVNYQRMYSGSDADPGSSFEDYDIEISKDSLRTKRSDR